MFSNYGHYPLSKEDRFEEDGITEALIRILESIMPYISKSKSHNWYEPNDSIEFYDNKIILKNLFFKIIITWTNPPKYFRFKLVINNWCKYYLTELYSEHINLSQILYSFYRNESYFYSRRFCDKAEFKRLNYCIVICRLSDEDILLFCSMGKIRQEYLISKNNIKARFIPRSYYDSSLYLIHQINMYIGEYTDVHLKETLDKFKIVHFNNVIVKSARSS